MLPPGIFIFKSGVGEMVSPTTPSSLIETHPVWAEDVVKYGPWDELVTVYNIGSFYKASHPCDSTIVVVEGCSTTMEVARVLVDHGALSEWGAVVSVKQAGGRGQLRRPWMSSPGNVHISIIIPQKPVAGPWKMPLSDLLPIVMGHVIGEVLRSLGADVLMKWPNDLLQGDRKVGGMLIEEKNGVIILGLGLNLVKSPTDDMMREDSSVKAGVLRIEHGFLSALPLCETLVNRGKNMYEVLLDELEPSQFIHTATNQLAWLGRNIKVREGGHDSYQAVITGLSPKGGLVLRRNGKEVVLFSGSIFPL